MPNFIALPLLYFQGPRHPQFRRVPGGRRQGGFNMFVHYNTERRVSQYQFRASADSVQCCKRQKILSNFVKKYIVFCFTNAIIELC